MGVAIHYNVCSIFLGDVCHKRHGRSCSVNVSMRYKYFMTAQCDQSCRRKLTHTITITTHHINRAGKDVTDLLFCLGILTVTQLNNTVKIGADLIKVFGVTVLNPGSISLPRQEDGKKSYAIMTVADDESVDFEICYHKE